MEKEDSYKRIISALDELSEQERFIFEELIKNANKDQIAIYRGDKKFLKHLFDLKLIAKNYIYRPYKTEESVIVLPYNPQLVKELSRDLNLKRRRGRKS